VINIKINIKNMFNPEQFLRNLSERQEKRKTLNNKEYLQELSIKAQEMNNINRIDPRQFINLYGRDAVIADLRWVKSRQAYFRTHDSETETWHKQVADILEAILHEQSSRMTILVKMFGRLKPVTMTTTATTLILF